MQYPDYPTKINGSVSHDVFLQYLRNYTDHFQLRKYIQFNTLVTKVFPVKGNGGWRTATWQMKMRNLNTNRKNVTICDGVMICNGHFAKPYIPEIPGLKETFPGKILYSRNYRVPEVFTNKTIVVLGSGNSAIDIAKDLGNYTKRIYLSYRSYKNNVTLIHDLHNPGNVKEVLNVLSANGSELTLQDNSTIKVDNFIFCTGYSFDFPFLDNRSGLVFEKNAVRPLYAEIFNVEYPSMGFIGLTDNIYYNDWYYIQVEDFASVMIGIVELPNYQTMLKNSNMI
ncbi:uncharacterized protein LOC131672147 [Phymastichus coffea]|uniref:uncharacterized protein LOC131672147 n=1 Tax=Phymastichus coffea TaxID=108790 RepID=UPI00273CCF5E|nr:uncharacterized protein LOC131672147 [Phymastichus coffea]XP_058805151.1 uncharacterized protein LOC131672147 [Phymastichus coffea]